MLLLILAFITGLLIGNIRKKTLMRDNQPYLIRWTIIKTKWFSIKLHKTLISDPIDPHDHPWNYTSLILWGGYYESTLQVIGLKHSKTPLLIPAEKWYGPGSLLFRKGDQLHKLIIPKNKFCLSLILTTKRYRDWGFVNIITGKWTSFKESMNYGNTTPTVVDLSVNTQRVDYSPETKEKIISFMKQRLPEKTSFK